MSDKKNYYAIIPANVRYDSDLSPNAKLLYGEITALCNDTGYCWSRNSYFAKLYKVDERSIKRWVASLCDKNYIISIIDQSDTKERRKIYLSGLFGKDCRSDPGQKCHELVTKMSRDPGQKCPETHDKNVLHNITRNITKNNNSDDGINSTSSESFSSSSACGCADFDMEWLGTHKLNPGQLKRIVESANWTNEEIQKMLNYFAFEVQGNTLVHTTLHPTEVFTRSLAKGTPWKKPLKYLHPAEKQKIIAKKRKIDELRERQAEVVRAAKEAQDAVFKPAFEKWLSQFSEDEAYKIACEEAKIWAPRRDCKNAVTSYLRNHYRKTPDGRALEAT